ncbi:MAG: hypothetical protein PHQ98_02415 [Candidatus ainarchaeum sp.]|nr:hypothetical protein [Candidatus ainarchaeum sp.]
MKTDLLNRLNFFSSSGQATIESIIIFSISLLLLTIFILILFDYQLTSSQNSQKDVALNAVTILSTEAKNLYLDGNNSFKEITVLLPSDFNKLASYIRNQEISISIYGESITKKTSFLVDGNFFTTSSKFILTNNNGVINITN